MNCGAARSDAVQPSATSPAVTPQKTTWPAPGGGGSPAAMMMVLYGSMYSASALLHSLTTTWIQAGPSSGNVCAAITCAAAWALGARQSIVVVHPDARTRQ